MSESIEIAFAEAISSVALETKSLTVEVVELLRGAIVEHTPLEDILQLLEMQ